MLGLLKRNTTFFHTQTVILAKKNMISYPFLGNGTWSTEEEEHRIEAARVP